MGQRGGGAHDPQEEKKKTFFLQYSCQPPTKGGGGELTLEPVEKVVLCVYVCVCVWRAGLLCATRLYRVGVTEAREPPNAAA